MKIKGYDENSHDGLPRLPRKSPTSRVGKVSEDGSFRVRDGRVFDPDTNRLRKVRRSRVSNDMLPKTEFS